MLTETRGCNQAGDQRKHISITPRKFCSARNLTAFRSWKPNNSSASAANHYDKTYRADRVQTDTLEPAALSRSGQAVPVSFPSWKPAQPFCVRNAYACARKTEGPEWRSLDAQ